MKREDRKAAVAAYKERKAAAGVYVVRCVASGEQWVGSTPNLETIWNRLSFMLRQGNERSPSLQAAWLKHGPESFAFEVVEPIDADDLAYSGDRTLRERASHWRERLQAELV